MPSNATAPSQIQFVVKGISPELKAAFAVACRQRGHKLNYVVKSLLQAYVEAVAEDQLRPIKISITQPPSNVERSPKSNFHQ